MKFPRRYSYRRYPRGGPGTELSMILAWAVTVQSESGKCLKCTRLRDNMDRWGKSGCELKRDDVIVPALLENRTLLAESLRRFPLIGSMLSQTVEGLSNEVLTRLAGEIVDVAIERSKPDELTSPVDI